MKYSCEWCGNAGCYMCKKGCMTKEKLLVLIIQSLPYPEEIDNIKLMNEGDGETVHFTWRGSEFRVTTGFHVTEILHSGVPQNNESILIEKLIKKVYLSSKIEK